MDLKQACALYRVSRQKLLPLCHRGEFGAVKVKGRWMFRSPPIREQCIGTRAIAETLGCSVQYVRDLCRGGRVEAFQIGRDWRVGVSNAARLFILRLNGFQKEGQAA